jgi:hypothetical protein
MGKMIEWRAGHGRRKGGGGQRCQEVGPRVRFLPEALDDPCVSITVFFRKQLYLTHLCGLNRINGHGPMAQFLLYLLVGASLKKKLTCRGIN